MRGLSFVVTAAVLGSALLHAVWNAMAKSVKDHLVGFVALELAAGALCLALLPVVPAPARAAWPYLAASAVLHVAYATFLLQSYRVGDLNQVYPIARGTAPMVVAVLAVPFAHEHLAALQLAGVLAVVLGWKLPLGARAIGGMAAFGALAVLVLVRFLEGRRQDSA